MNIPNWFYDERVQQIAPEKLNLLLHLAAQLEGKTSQKEIMPVLIGAIASASRQNLMFCDFLQPLHLECVILPVVAVDE